MRGSRGKIHSNKAIGFCAVKMPEFIPGLQLSELFYKEAVGPILRASFPHLGYAAARLGYGSEVLGYDDAMSRDHDWGPRLTLFLPDDNLKTEKPKIDEVLGNKLPHQFRGYSTNWSLPREDQTWALVELAEGPINHRVEITSVRDFLLGYIGFDITGELTPADWLTFPQQKLLGITAGKVFHDDVELQAVREYFSWYPQDVWLYLLASVWQRIGQEEHLMGRAGEAGSEIGSALIAARLVSDILRLCFLLEKRYAPYPKWFGQAFSQLKSSGVLGPILAKVLQSENWQARDRWLASSYETCMRMFNDLGITDKMPEQSEQFYNRPFRVIWGENAAKQIVRKIEDPPVKRIASRSLIGNIDLFTDNTDLLEDPQFRNALRQLFQG
jgi:hypothetical protein